MVPSGTLLNFFLHFCTRCLQPELLSTTKNCGWWFENVWTHFYSLHLLHLHRTTVEYIFSVAKLLLHGSRVKETRHRKCGWCIYMRLPPSDAIYLESAMVARGTFHSLIHRLWLRVPRSYALLATSSCQNLNVWCIISMFVRSAWHCRLNPIRRW